MSKKISITIKYKKKMKIYSISILSTQTGKIIHFVPRKMTKQDMINFCSDVIKFFYLERGHSLFINPYTLQSVRNTFLTTLNVDVDFFTSGSSAKRVTESYLFTFSEINL